MMTIGIPSQPAVWRVDEKRIAIAMGYEGVLRIGLERQRQIEKEGWTKRHDSNHHNGELATAGAVYAMPIQTRITSIWPWDYSWYKPYHPQGCFVEDARGRVRELEKAGALIAAEIDRLLALL
jgi:hypothetical protein